MRPERLDSKLRPRMIHSRLISVAVLAAAILASRADAAGTQPTEQPQASPGQTVSPQTPPAPATTSQTHPPVLRLEPSDRPILIQNAGGSGFPSWATQLLAGLLTMFATLFAVGMTNRQNAKNTEKTLTAASTNAQAAINQKANDLEIAALEGRLSTFFGPFLQLSEENKRLAQILHERQASPDFRTLTALLDPAWKKTASTTDKNLAEQLVANGVGLRKLIREQAGPVSSVLLPYLSKASAHFTILELAHVGKLVDGIDAFRDYVYPRELDEVLELERQRLENRRNALRAELAKQHGPIDYLVVPPHLTLGDPARSRSEAS